MYEDGVIIDDDDDDDDMLTLGTRIFAVVCKPSMDNGVTITIVCNKSRKVGGALCVECRRK
jgi:hypothetical protein